MTSAYEIESAAPSRRNGEARRLAGKGKRLRDHGNTRHKAGLTPAMKRALRILYVEGRAIQETKFWRTAKRTGIPLETVIALYDRYLVMIVYESRHRRRQTAELTEIGRLVAERLNFDARSADDFESSTNVYGAEPEPDAEPIE